MVRGGSWVQSRWSSGLSCWVDDPSLFEQVLQDEIVFNLVLGSDETTRRHDDIAQIKF